jgi:hypothetical protein
MEFSPYSVNLFLFFQNVSRRNFFKMENYLENSSMGQNIFSNHKYFFG